MAEPGKKKTALAIDENRISFALLFLLIAIGASYGLWQIVQPLMVQSAQQEDQVSRRQLADDFSNDRQYEEAVLLYEEILGDDPLNGYVTAKLALTYENMMRNLSGKERKIYDETENSIDLPSDELEQLDKDINVHLLKAIDQYAKLKDHLRFRAWGTGRQILLYAIKAERDDDEQYAQKAIRIARDSLEGNYGWPRIFSSQEAQYLMKYPEFRKLSEMYPPPPRIF